MATAAQKARIKKLQEKVDAQQQKVVATMSATASKISAIDPEAGLKLAQTAKKNAAPGSREYQDAIRSVTEAQNVASGVTAKRNDVREFISSGAGNPGSGYTGGDNGAAAASAAAATAAAAKEAAAERASSDAEKAATKKASRENATTSLITLFTQYGLGSLASKISELVIKYGVDMPDTIQLELSQTKEYKTRFKANDVRIKNGISVLTPGEYLGYEDEARQVLRAYGLNQFDNDEYISGFIANDMSKIELNNRIATAVQRVQNADPAIMDQLTNYYGIAKTDLVAYVLDPSKQFETIQRQVEASEIGSAAARQGLTAGRSVAEQLASQGVTQDQANKGYSDIADILPTANKLSDIYGGEMDTYGQAEAEQETFNGLASAQRRRKKLADTEIASFSGSSGTSKGAFSTGYLNKQSGSGQF